MGDHRSGVGFKFGMMCCGTISVTRCTVCFIRATVLKGLGAFTGEGIGMNKLIVVLLGVMPLAGLSWSASHGQSGEDGPKATTRNHDFQNSLGIRLTRIRLACWLSRATAPNAMYMRSIDRKPSGEGTWYRRCEARETGRREVSDSQTFSEIVSIGTTHIPSPTG
jgi:hypothetical protein